MFSTNFTHNYCKALLLLGFFMVRSLIIYAQESDTVESAPVDTVTLSLSQIIPISISCNIIDAYGSGDMELIAINSKSDAISVFGYNCDIPDSDYTNYTLLCCSVKSAWDVKYNVKIYGDNLLLTLNTYKATLMKRYLVRLLIPKMARNSNMHLDVNEQ